MALLCLRPISSRLSLLPSASASSRVTLLHLSKCYFRGFQPKRLFWCRSRAARYQSEDDYDYVEEEEEGFGDDGYLSVRLSLSLTPSLTHRHALKTMQCVCFRKDFVLYLIIHFLLRMIYWNRRKSSIVIVIVTVSLMKRKVFHVSIILLDLSNCILVMN